MQRQIGGSWVIDAGYAGSFSDNINIAHKLDILPEKYWGAGLVRADALQTDLSSNVPNPFRTTNFASLQQSSPGIYLDMSQQAFYNNATIRKSNLLRPFPQMNANVTNNTVPDGKTRTHQFELNVEKRFSQGFNLNLGYTALSVREKTSYFLL